MTTQPAPAPDNRILPDTLTPQDVAYLDRLDRALRCGVSGCECATGSTLHCPSHSHAEAPTLTVFWDERRECLAFHCPSCPPHRIYGALAKRGLSPATEFYTPHGAQGAGLQPFRFFVQQSPDWLWPNRIPLGKLTLVAGYPSSGKTSIALDIAARVSRGAPAPDQPDAPFPAAPVVLALLDGNPKSDVLPILRLFGADLNRVYLADLLSPTHPVDYYPDDPPADDGGITFPDVDDDWDDDDDEDGYVFDNDGNEIRAPRRRKPVGSPAPVRDPFWPPPDSGSKLTAPWPPLDKVMGRLANYIAEGKAALLVVDQVEDLASMHRARLTTVLGMLKALAARTGAAVIALTHNPAPNYPRAVTAMQNRLAQASVVFTTAFVEPGERRFLVPLRPAMSDEAPAIPYVLPSSQPSSFLRRQEPRSPSPSSAGSPSSLTPPSSVVPSQAGTSPPASSVIPAKAGIQGSPADNYTVAWRKPILPAHLKALTDPNRDHGARTRAAQAFLTRALAGGPRPAAAIEREAAMLGISRRTLFRARAICNVASSRVSKPGGSNGAGEWHWSLPPRNTMQQDAASHGR